MTNLSAMCATDRHRMHSDIRRWCNWQLLNETANITPHIQLERVA